MSQSNIILVSLDTTPYPERKPWSCLSCENEFSSRTRRFAFRDGYICSQCVVPFEGTGVPADAVLASRGRPSHQSADTRTKRILDYVDSNPGVRSGVVAMVITEQMRAEGLMKPEQEITSQFVSTVKWRRQQGHYTDYPPLEE